MDAGLLLYNGLVLGASAALPFVWLAGRITGRYAELWPRLGRYSDLPPAGPEPRVWLQAVSVGEVGVARAIADELFKKVPQASLTITTSTEKGLEEAKKVFAVDAVVAPFPLDAPWAVAAAVQKIKPQVYASLETELWPNVFARAEKAGAEVMLLNGRISPRSHPGYLRARPLLASTVRRIRVCSMISPADAKRIKELGADPKRVRIDGNAKYAGLSGKVNDRLLDFPAGKLALARAPMIVAGSVRTGEEAPVLAAFSRVLHRHPRAVLAAVPRHVEKAPRWMETCRQLGLKAQLWSDLQPWPRKPDTNVVVVDAMGVLFALYGLASAAFVGASLVKLGGQNPMEPAAWGVPVFYGESMEDFRDASQALSSAGAAAVVSDSEELGRSLLVGPGLPQARPNPWARRASEVDSKLVRFGPEPRPAS